MCCRQLMAACVRLQMSFSRSLFPQRKLRRIITGSVVVETEACSELHSFPHPFFLLDFICHPYHEKSTGFEARTLLEKQLDAFTHTIRTKPQCWEEVWNAKCVSQWRTEPHKAWQTMCLHSESRCAASHCERTWHNITFLRQV